MKNLFDFLFNKGEYSIEKQSSEYTEAIMQDIESVSLINQPGYRIGINVVSQALEGMRRGQLVVMADVYTDMENICESYEEKELAIKTFEDNVSENENTRKIVISNGGLDVDIWCHSDMPEEDLKVQLSKMYGDIEFKIRNA